MILLRHFCEDKMVNYLMKLQYDGSRYKGFQRLGMGEKTIQSEVEKALFVCLGEKIKITATSRTDAGVHAMCQWANFKIKAPIKCEEEFIENINNALPDDIRVYYLGKVPLKFHSRYDAVGKQYIYTMHFGEVREVFKRKYVYELNEKPDVEKMRQLSGLFVGEKDFFGFSSTKEHNDTVRRITELEVVEEGEYIKIKVTGDGFLYNMIRIIAGTLLYAGYGRIDETDILEVFESGNRELAGPTLPGKGLVLWKIF